jgi:hypothetical protein
MRIWHDFLDSIDSDGGKILLLILLMLIGFGGSKLGVPNAEDIIMGAFGALLLALKDSGSNKDRREGGPMPLPTTAGAAPVVVVPAVEPPAADTP